MISVMIILLGCSMNFCMMYFDLIMLDDLSVLLIRLSYKLPFNPVIKHVPCIAFGLDFYLLN